MRYRGTAKLDSAIACNCSICSKTGSMLTFAPATPFELLSGQEFIGAIPLRPFDGKSLPVD